MAKARRKKNGSPVKPDLNAGPVESDAKPKKQPESKPDSPEEKSDSVDAIDDPVRMYLMQMGRIPLLTRDQEIAAAIEI